MWQGFRIKAFEAGMEGEQHYTTQEGQTAGDRPLLESTELAFCFREFCVKPSLLLPRDKQPSAHLISHSKTFHSLTVQRPPKSGIPSALD